MITAETATGLPAQPVPIAGTAFAFGPDGIVFSEPVMLTIGYDPANVPQGVPEAELRLHKLVDGGYVEVDAGAVDVTNHTVSGTINGFSVFVILQRMATHVVITTQPTNAVSGEPISPPVVAEIRYANGDLAEFVVAPVTLTIEANPRGGTLSGVTTVNTIGGVATFDGLSIDKPATDHTLTAASGTLASVTSEPFSIAQRICTLTPAPVTLPTGQGGPYTLNESRIPDLIGTFLMDGDFNDLGSVKGNAVADFNGDGLDDLIYSGPIFPNTDVGVPVRIMANDGAGNFYDATSTIIAGTVPAPLNAADAVIADFNGDGWPDVFFANVGRDERPGPGAHPAAGAGELNTLLLSNGAGQLVHSPGNIHNVPTFTPSAAAGDVDCDGDIDIYVSNIGTPINNGPNYFLINDGTGNFAVRPDYLPEAVLFKPGGLSQDWNSATIADLDGDNFPELVLGGGDPGPSIGNYQLIGTVILWNDGTGNFNHAEMTLVEPGPGVGGPPAIIDMDIDGDGDLDLIMSGNEWATFNRTIQIVVNNGDRTFTDESDLRVFGLTGDSDIFVSDFVPIDFNGDGAPDFVIQSDVVVPPGYPQGYPQLIFINNGSGVFTALDNSVLANKSGILFPVDADGDGGLDFIVWNLVYPAIFDFSLLVHQ